MEETQRVLLAGVDTGADEDFAHSMEELASLAEACNMQVVGTVTQKADAIHKALYIGSGKVNELRRLAESTGAEAVIFEDSLSPSQLRNLTEELDLNVMDRTNLILDIFATRAKSREAKLQVETARLKYLLPRLTGMYESLSRQGGTSGSKSSRGVGETKLELDRRKIEHRISELSRELKEISGERKTQRKKRQGSDIPQVALAGYTNAGKSTLLNAMVEAYIGEEEKSVLEKDMLFATLETNVRRIDDGTKRPFFLADTVGFIHKLPHGLVQAFRSTLEEIKNADLILHVIDFSDPHYKKQIQVTEETLRELGAGDVPILFVYNKADLCMENIPVIKEGRIYMSAKSRVGLRELVKMITESLYADNEEAEFFVPYDKGGILSYLNEHGRVLDQDYEETGVRLKVNCRRHDKMRFADYLTENGIALRDKMM